MKNSSRVLYPLLALVLAAAAALALLALRFGWFSGGTAEVHLPETTAAPPPGAVTAGGGLTPAAVTPETVQAVVATLQRPDSYSRSMRVESFWSGGRQGWTVNVWQKNGALRIRLVPDGGEDKNILFGAGAVHIWYGDSRDIFRCEPDAPELADTLQMIPSYEDVLALDLSQIEEAGYVLRNDQWRIMVAERESPTGCLMVYYISIETGLLEAAERYDGAELVYSMTARQADLAAPADVFFTIGG